MEHISIDDFKKVEARIGRVLVAEAVPDSDKLIRFELDFGPKALEGQSVAQSPDEQEPQTQRDIRQILSAIREWYPNPEALIGKSMLFVTNLAPRAIRGLESNGMLMAVTGLDGQPVFLIPDQDVVPGSLVR
jgi:methionyl-tRNA synthetase